MRNLLITGASRGIGRATARLAGARGWSVGINYLGNDAAAEQAADEVRAAGGKAVLLRGDVAQEDDVIRCFDQATRELGQLDGVVINAGIVGPRSLLADMEAARIRHMFDVNAIGAYLCAREASRRLCLDRGGNGGAIVFVSSASAKLGSPFEFTDYAGSKAAVDMLTRGLAIELGRQGVRVNGVRPGLIETEIHASAGQPDRAQHMGVKSPLGRPGRPEEVAEAVIWLLSDAASYTSGAIIDVAGGR